MGGDIGSGCWLDAARTFWLAIMVSIDCFRIWLKLSRTTSGGDIRLLILTLFDPWAAARAIPDRDWPLLLKFAAIECSDEIET